MKEKTIKALNIAKQAAGIRSVLKGIAKNQGMTCRVYPHKMRKTLGMVMINKGEDISTVRLF